MSFTGQFQRSNAEVLETTRDSQTRHAALDCGLGRAQTLPTLLPEVSHGGV